MGIHKQAGLKSINLLCFFQLKESKIRLVYFNINEYREIEVQNRNISFVLPLFLLPINGSTNKFDMLRK